MFGVNEYFDGNVKSLSFKDKEGSSSVGVMATGEYEFGTSSVEFMTVVSGKMEIMFSGESEWKEYSEFETFMVDKDSKFKVRVIDQVSYLCKYR